MLRMYVLHFTKWLQFFKYNLE